jgi:Tol biopolymer transport system component
MPPADLETGGNGRFSIALAPDGRRLAFAATRNDVSQLWLRDLTSNDLQALSGTDDAFFPFWSPDGSALGFFSRGRLQVFVFADGTTRDLADAPSPMGGTWHSNGDIVFAPSADGGLLRRSSDGRLAPFTTLDAAAERSHRFPQLSADRRHIIFFVDASEPTREGIWIARYDDPAARRRLAKSDAQGLLVDDSLIYSSEGALIAQRIDAEQRLTGTSRLLGTPVGRSADHELFATIGGGVLLFGTPSSRLRELRWLDRAGNALGVLGEPMDAREVRVDPSGERAAVSRVDPQLNTLDIWVYEGDRPLPRRLSLALSPDESAVWSRDGRRLAWVTGRQALTIRDVDASAPEVTVRKFAHPISVTDWPTADSLVISELRDETRSDVSIVSVDSDTTPRSYAATPFNEAYAVVSPDRRWLAYASDESGRFEIYVDSFPTPGRRARLTAGGGTEPRWSSQGSEIFFRREREIHVARLDFSRPVPQAVSSGILFAVSGDIRSFDTAPDDERFLVNVAAPDSGPRPMTAIVNVRSRLIESRR